MADSSKFFPLRAAGFRSNPFRALTDAECGDVAVLGPAVLDLFDRNDAHLQILGALGAGKTTTLLGLQVVAQDRHLRVGYEYIPDGQRWYVTPVDSLHLFLLDEAQRLSGRELRRLLGQVRGGGQGGPRVVLASHADLTARFAEARRALATVDVDGLSAAEYRAILGRRVTQAALPGRAHATLAEDVAPYLLATFDTDRRAAERLLYVTFQRLRAPDLIDAARLEAVRGQISGSGGDA